jgi:hypothetical protein
MRWRALGDRKPIADLSGLRVSEARHVILIGLRPDDAGVRITERRLL